MWPEGLCGYDALDVRVAARIPMARQGTVESRPVMDIPGLLTNERA
jgi:hypothetical protein